MGKTNQTLNLLKYNMGTLLGFELIFKIMTILIGSPLFVGFFNMTMKITGYNYLTIENISNFMFHPITILSLLLLIVLMTIYTMFEITTIIILLEEARQKKKIRLIDAVKASIEKCKKLLSPKNVLLPFLVLFMIPVLNIGISSSLISTIKIPEFIMDYITSNNTLILIFIGLFALLLYFLFRWIYSIHYMVLEDKDFRSARKSSVKLGKFHRIRDLITLGITHFYIFFMLILFVLLGILFLLMIHKVLLEELFAKAILTSIITIMIGVTIFIYAILSTPINYAVISCMYYEKKEKQKENIPNLNITSDPKKNIGLKVLITILMFCSIGLGTYFIDGLYKGKYNLNIEYIRTMEVTAHRGASVAYPENTMSAFIGAKKQGADWIELDVQQTKDQVIIVSHDTNLKRVTGINKDVIDLTYKEIEKLDAGSFKDTKFKGEKIPTLEEVIDFAKENNMRLNIELKPTGKEKDFEKQVVELIQEKDFQSKCVITSQVYEVLEKVKKVNKEIETVYVMSIAYGDIVKLKAADHFSVEASNVNDNLVSKVHNEGKQIYAWTVNTQESINKMIEYNVDNIITDDVPLAQKMIKESKQSNFINEFIKFINGSV